MVRAKEAPVETAKFMGHGFCDHVTKSVTLNSFTCDLDIIMQNVFNIKENLNIPPSELRGIGIQISKLNTGIGDNTKSNVLRNMFEKASERNQNEKREANKESAPKCNIYHVESIPSKSPRKATASSSKNSRSLRKVKSFNSSSDRDIKHMFTNVPTVTTRNNKIHEMYQELDMDVLAELPEDIREQVLQEQLLVLNRRIPLPATTRRCHKEQHQPESNRVANTSTASIRSTNDGNFSENNALNHVDLIDCKQPDDPPTKSTDKNEVEFISIVR